ncbi:hypothetical protein PV328_011719 [Microctonus aethiopoides]|uniref:Uncharacterized protein n=1 Tax=Microctonus aethiopoides TaxID=144406 RepID=A0AA39EXB1_9HYME|nr:hypothetical protein PV328_011719 [Microctonus aethiopoides]
MAAGLARNTPTYIWRRELGVAQMDTVIKERLWRYMRKVYEMEAERWPKICLREEVRNILDRKPTVWGMKLLGVARDMYIEKVFEDIWNGVDVGAIRRTIDGGLRKLGKDYDDEDEMRLSVSTYNSWYKDLSADDLEAKCWEDKALRKMREFVVEEISDVEQRCYVPVGIGRIVDFVYFW